MFTMTARYYDPLYSFKDYGSEAARLSAIIRRARPGARRLLDVACGTGRHIECLRGRFDVEGVYNPGTRSHKSSRFNGDQTQLTTPR